MTFIKNCLDKVLGAFCILLFGFLVLLVTWQVVTRFVLNDPSVISEELAKYCFVWLVLFGGAFVFGERGHMAVEFIRDKLPGNYKMLVEIFIEIVIIVFSAAVLIKGGLKATTMTMTQLSAALQVPVGYLYAALPLSGLFIVFYCLHNIYDIWGKRKSLT